MKNFKKIMTMLLLVFGASLDAMTPRFSARRSNVKSAYSHQVQPGNNAFQQAKFNSYLASVRASHPPKAIAGVPYRATSSTRSRPTSPLSSPSVSPSRTRPTSPSKQTGQPSGNNQGIPLSLVTPAGIALSQNLKFDFSPVNSQVSTASTGSRSPSLSRSRSPSLSRSRSTSPAKQSTPHKQLSVAEMKNIISGFPSGGASINQQSFFFSPGVTTVGSGVGRSNSPSPVRLQDSSGFPLLSRSSSASKGRTSAPRRSRENSPTRVEQKFLEKKNTTPSSKLTGVERLMDAVGLKEIQLEPLGLNLSERAGYTKPVVRYTAKGITSDPNYIAFIKVKYSKEKFENNANKAFVELSKDIVQLKNKINKLESGATKESLIAIREHAKAVRKDMNDQIVAKKVKEYVESVKGSEVNLVIDATAKLNEASAKLKEKTDPVDSRVARQNREIREKSQDVLVEVQNQMNLLKKGDSINQKSVDTAKANDTVDSAKAAKNPTDPQLVKNALVSKKVLEQVRAEKHAAEAFQKKINAKTAEGVRKFSKEVGKDGSDPILDALNALAKHYETSAAPIAAKIKDISNGYSKNDRSSFDGIVRELTNLIKSDRRARNTLSTLEAYTKVLPELNTKVEAYNQKKVKIDKQVKSIKEDGKHKNDVEAALQEARELLSKETKKSEVEILQEVVRRLELDVKAQRLVDIESARIEVRIKEMVAERGSKHTVKEAVEKTLLELKVKIESKSNSSVEKLALEKLLEEYKIKKDNGTLDKFTSTSEFVKFFEKFERIEDIKIYEKVIKDLQRNADKVELREKQIDKIAYDMKAKVGSKPMTSSEIAAEITKLQDARTAPKNDAEAKIVIEKFNTDRGTRIDATMGMEKFIKIYEELAVKAKAGEDFTHKNSATAALPGKWGAVGENLYRREILAGLQGVPGASGTTVAAGGEVMYKALESVGVTSIALTGTGLLGVVGILREVSPALISIMSNDNLTPEEKQELQRQLMADMATGVSGVILSDKTGVSMETLASGNLEAIGIEAGMSQLISNITPENSGGSSYSGYGGTAISGYGSGQSSAGKAQSRMDEMMRKKYEQERSSSVGSSASSPGAHSKYSYPSLEELEAMDVGDGYPSEVLPVTTPVVNDYVEDPVDIPSAVYIDSKKYEQQAKSMNSSGLKAFIGKIAKELVEKFGVFNELMAEMRSNKKVESQFNSLIESASRDAENQWIGNYSEFTFSLWFINLENNFVNLLNEFKLSIVQPVVSDYVEVPVAVSLPVYLDSGKYEQQAESMNAGGLKSFIGKIAKSLIEELGLFNKLMAEMRSSKDVKLQFDSLTESASVNAKSQWVGDYSKVAFNRWLLDLENSLLDLFKGLKFTV